MPEIKVMEQTKPWYLSLTIWGVVAAFIGTYVLPHIGLSVDPTDISKVSESWTQLLDEAVTFGGLLLAIYGRAKADKKLVVKA